ncbi:MAG TPA: phosphoribosyltransferase [Steroidobacteraceae bacterium]|nr:phosphoribosyltransferase [Steroidobacteraceae bacterium]
MISVPRAIFQDRSAAGRQLAALLQQYAGDPNVLVLALPRGGLSVASEIARALHAPLDVLVVRKLGLPWQPEVAAGAIGPAGVIIKNPQVAPFVADFNAMLGEVAAHELIELQRRELAYRPGRTPLEVRDRVVILVDDGMATGLSMEAAVLTLRVMQPRAIVVAVPVAPPEAIAMLKASADQVVCARQPQPFMSVGQWYEEFPQLSDAEVLEILARHEAESRHPGREHRSRSATRFARQDY